jgi:hypothetical protein
MLHNNGHLHTAAHTSESLCQLKSGIMKHPLYSPDSAPDSHLFGPLTGSLRGSHFASNQDVKEAVHAWLVTQKYFFSKGTQKLVDCWSKCVEKDENNIEKLCYCTCSL